MKWIPAEPGIAQPPYLGEGPIHHHRTLAHNPKLP